MIDSLQSFVSDQPALLRWLAIALISMIPFVECYSGTAIGILVGVHPVAAATAAITGNSVIVLAIVLFSSSLRGRLRQSALAQNPTDAKPMSPRRARAKKLFDRFGVPGVSLLGHPTQISSAALIGFGARRRSVIVWQLVSIALWGTAVATLVGLGVQGVVH